MNLLPAKQRAETPLAYLVERIRTRAGMRDGEARPAAILWTDPGNEWRGILDLLQEQMSELFVLGADYEPEKRRGPAIWLRCVVDGPMRNGDPDGFPAPILYLPGVARQRLRAGEDCPDRIKPLVDLLHRGVAWHHPNGRDWTPVALFGSREGMALSIASDASTARALREALSEVVLTAVAQLRGRRLEADDFERLLVDDLPRNVLQWLDNSAKTRARLGGRWNAFRSRCQAELVFDPEDGRGSLAAGRQLAEGAGAWGAVWNRYADAPQSFPGVEELLRSCQPPGQLLTANPARWPEENDRREAALRSALTELPALPFTDACREIARLEASHGPRRAWVWTRLGQAPFAQALEPLARLATAVRSPLGGSTPDELATVYRERGWQADVAGWEALVELGIAEEQVVGAVVRHLLEPWLEDSARAFQDAVRRQPLPGRDEQPTVEADEDGCVFFVDGLRYDLGQRLAENLAQHGLRVEVNTRWAALPTVTATAKAAISPVAGDIEGETLGADFAPRFSATGKSVNAQRLRDALEERGYQILGRGEFDAPRTATSRGWLETGDIDKAGHHEQEHLGRRLPGELERIRERIAGLLDSGWRSVRVVTDHGWLLLPGGLGRADLPKHLTESRWARCAVVAGSGAIGVPLGRWHWNRAAEFATAPGIACFNKSDAFAHGGLSVQECLTPDILVEREPDAIPVSIESVSWVRFRCHVVASARREGLTADLRLGGPAGPSVAQSPKPVDADGSASLVLADDTHEDAALLLVLYDGDGQLIASRETRVGENS